MEMRKRAPEIIDILPWLKPWEDVKISLKDSLKGVQYENR